MKIKNIIWDFDGTLFDTYPALTRIVQDVLNDNSVQLDYDTLYNNLCKSVKATIQWLVIDYQIPKECIAQISQKEYIEGLNLIKPIDGVCQFLKKCSEYHIRSFLFTHRDNSVFRYLDKYDFTKYFEGIISVKDGFKRKPNSEGYEFLIEKYGLKPEETLVIGDRLTDIIAAKEIPVYKCFFSPSNIKCSDADFCFAKYDELWNKVLK